MKTKLCIWSMALLVMALAFVGCKGNNNNPDDPKTDDVKSNYTSPTIVSVTSDNDGFIVIELEDGTMMDFHIDYNYLVIRHVWNKEVIQGEANVPMRAYDKTSCVVPESVNYNGQKYIVKEVYSTFMQDGDKFLYGELFENLTVIKFPPSMTYFHDCCNSLPHLTDIYCYASEPPHLASTAPFHGVKFTLHVPKGSIAKYEDSSEWAKCDIKNIVAIEN